jgi:hypothetical protein
MFAGVYYPFAQFGDDAERVDRVRATRNLRRTIAAVKEQVWTVISTHWRSGR